ncbi:MAG: hypothetical protein WCP79_15470 [Bacillota bacterium]
MFRIGNMIGTFIGIMLMRLFSKNEQPVTNEQGSQSDNTLGNYLGFLLKLFVWSTIIPGVLIVLLFIWLGSQ